MAPAGPPWEVCSDVGVLRAQKGLLMKLRAFQRAFIRGATAPGIDTAALSVPRGNGKSWLAAHLLARVLTPGDDLFRPGTESVLCAGTLEQARIVFRFLRADARGSGRVLVHGFG